jgi:hypothetical protein
MTKNERLESVLGVGKIKNIKKILARDIASIHG